MSSGFITEAEIEAAKKKRQEEWEKVRQPDQPLEVAEVPYDSRSLYEKLKEQKDKKDYEYEEAHKLKNLIRGLDDDEVDFLEVVDKAKSVAEQKQQDEENQELRDFREKVASMQEKNMDHKIQADLAKPKVSKISTRPSQKNLLSGLVRKRAAAPESTGSGSIETPTDAKKTNTNPVNVDDAKSTPESQTTEKPKTAKVSAATPPTGLYCVGVLPGIGKYTESSDSEKSTDTDEDYDFTSTSYDWVGRKIEKDTHNHSHQSK